MVEAGGRLSVDVTRGPASPANRAGLLEAPERSGLWEWLAVLHDVEDEDCLDELDGLAGAGRRSATGWGIGADDELVRLATSTNDRHDE